MWTSLAAIVSTAREDGRLAPPPAQHKTLGRWVTLMLLRGDDGAAAAAVAPAPAGEENPNQNQALATLADGAGLADKLANVNAAMAAMEADGIRCRGYKAADVVEGKPAALAEVVWQLMLHYHCRWRPSAEELAALASPSTSLGEGTAPMSPQQRTKLSFEWGLLVWIRGLVPKELNVKDLAYETWQDGKAMCFLVDKLCGTDSPINMQEVMNCTDGEENLQRAFAAAADKLKIPRLLDEGDFFLEKAKAAQNLIDERSLVAYITYFKNHHDNVPFESLSPSYDISPSLSLYMYIIFICPYMAVCTCTYAYI
ncbi:uncharacterized protein ACA1_060180 [Acanthamoeba castellanii str. Neff]|uniref:Calponin-homology (CH) domain-containing protein n=1 Tax=Acanthamoeba castellanii (strain ATCC 30010 / Neff) TaxID=1257118 RepID=L8GYU6_ACACF|nr:uncharacterized protein ACA1_060180 [Acanthamoeba castellanii str. Neff]ELR17291.1 hypothetical protein ACA1_060180 [Acanthamoeba castellanii str. Neff]